MMKKKYKEKMKEINSYCNDPEVTFPIHIDTLSNNEDNLRVVDEMTMKGRTIHWNRDKKFFTIYLAHYDDCCVKNNDIGISHVCSITHRKIFNDKA